MKTYEEYLYGICTETDLNDAGLATELTKFLAKEALKYHDLAMDMDQKLMEVMSYKDYSEWSKEQGKAMFRKNIETMPDGEFKDFCIENFGEITGEE